MVKGRWIHVYFFVGHDYFLDNAPNRILGRLCTAEFVVYYEKKTGSLCQLLDSLFGLGSSLGAKEACY